MARIRELKPSFFRNEQLAELPHWVRLLFQGLWGLADRTGRLEDRPRRIGVDVFPYESLPIEDGLTQLASAGFIDRYRVGNVAVIQIVSFAKHQKPHPKEASFGLPDKPGPDKGSNEPGNSTAQPGNYPEGSVGSLALGLSGSLALGLEVPNGTSVRGKTANPVCPQREIVALYHEILPELPEVRVWDEGREKLLRSRWREAKERQTLDWWRGYFEFVRRCPFLLGQVQSAHRDPFLADLEWLISPKNFRKVLEGKYQQREAA